MTHGHVGTATYRTNLSFAKVGPMWVWVRYQLERWVLRGAWALVALMIVMQGWIALTGALIAYYLPPRVFSSYLEALWWAILRLSDTGYLSDDTGIELRALSMCLSVFGMAITVGGIVAIVSQLINRGLRSLSAATTEVPFSGHVVILGFTDRTPRLLRALLLRGRFKIVVLVDTVDESVVRRVHRAVRKATDRERIVLRSGSARRPAELQNAACARARAIIIPASQQAVAGDPEAGPKILQTMFALKTLLASVSRPPQIAVEIVDRSLAPLVASAMPQARVLQSDRLVARVFRFALQGRNLVEFAIDVFEPDQGYRLEEFVFPELAGCTLRQAERRLVGGRLMGAYQASEGGKMVLVMDAEAVVQDNTSVLVFSEGLVTLAPLPDEPDRVACALEIPREALKILVLGWNECASDLLGELNLESAGRYSVDFISKISVEERQFEVTRMVPHPQLVVRHFWGDPMAIDDAGDVALAAYDRVVVLADRLASPDSADVRTLAVVLALGARRAEMKPGSYTLVELLDEDNSGLLGDAQVVVTARLAADTLCSLALTDEAGHTLQMSLGHQVTFVTRVFDVEAPLAHDEVALARALRDQRLGLLHVFHDRTEGGTCRVLACEAVSVPISAAMLATREDV